MKMDGMPISMVRKRNTSVDYVLRAMIVPGGEHTIEFKFEPQVIKTGSTITLISAVGMLLLLGGGIYYERKKRFKNVD
jgi:LPXTG-motif cell wall-anchored protein